jgi:hypothetical protein
MAWHRLSIFSFTGGGMGLGWNCNLSADYADFVVSSVERFAQIKNSLKDQSTPDAEEARKRL